VIFDRRMVADCGMEQFEKFYAIIFVTNFAIFDHLAMWQFEVYKIWAKLIM
jgi:hypothetical protein